MKIEQEISLLDRLQLEDPAQRWSYAPASMRNPADHYVGRQWFEDEREALFRGRPLFVGLSGECAKPGAYFTRDLGGIPIAVVRQRDGSLKAFVNICRHRAATLLSGSGEGGLRRIVCPYHAWTYELDGRLVNQPSSDDAFDDVKHDCNLIARAVSEQHGLIFVHPSSNAPFEIDPLLGGVEGEFDRYGIATAVPIETRTRVWNMNYKLLIDSFMEAYHVRYVHRKTIDPTFFSHQMFDRFGRVPRIVGLRRSVMEQFKSAPREDWRLFPHAAAVYVLIPNTMLFYQGDHLETWRVEPIDTDTTRAHVSIFAPEEPKSEKARNYWIKNLDLLCRVADTEDFPMQEQIHANLKSGAVPDVVYGKIEPALIHMHSEINAAVEAYRAGRRAAQPA